MFYCRFRLKNTKKYNKKRLQELGVNRERLEGNLDDKFDGCFYYEVFDKRDIELDRLTVSYTVNDPEYKFLLDGQPIKFFDNGELGLDPVFGNFEVVEVDGLHYRNECNRIKEICSNFYVN